MNGLFNQNEFDRFVLDNKVIGFFEHPIKLKSGRESNWYVNWRNISEDVFLLDKLTDYVISFTKFLELDPDCFYGVPEGATKLGLITQYKWAKKSSSYKTHSHVLPMGRGKPKDHGEMKDGYFIGEPRGKTIILEDVTTTGDSLLATIDDLIKLKVQVIAAFGLTNRMELRDDYMSVEEVIEQKYIPYCSLSDAFRLLPQVCKESNPKQDIVRSIEEEFKKYGIKELKLFNSDNI